MKLQHVESSTEANHQTRFYVPTSAITESANLTTLDPIPGTNGTAHFARLSAGATTTDRVIILNTPALPNLIKLDLQALQQVFEEDVPVYGHPRDPYKRIDILASSRRVRVELGGVVLAETSAPLFLLETTLRRRTYVPPTCVNWDVLRPSRLLTLCPYKGTAEYYDVVADGKVYENVVWYYRYPTAESVAIAGYMCFYDEKVDVWIDGVKEER
jgi:uncharacterized protein (DUF427 family)